MKKYIVLLLLTITLLPILVQAEDKSIVLKSISLNEKSDNVVEVSPATIKDNKLLVDFKMYEVGDYIEYKIKVQNNSRETLEVDESRLLPSVNYIKYSVDSNSKSIKAGEEKDILLKITYQNKVENGDYFSAKYINQDKIPLVFKSPTIINPETIRNILPILLIIGIMIGYSIYNKKKINLSKAMILLLLLGLIPYTTSALEEEIIIESNIMIRKVKPTACTFDGEMVQGAEYVNGQYTYRYMQEKNSGANWSNIEADGWGVTLTDKDSTEAVTSTVCSTINDKPLVSTQSMFGNSKTSSIDTSSFDTSEVISMQQMFLNVPNIIELDTSYLDTSKVTDMTAMFASSRGLTELDLSGFDTSKVINMYAMFASCNLTSLDVSNFETFNVTNMQAMFAGNNYLTELNLNSFYTSKVTNMSTMFDGCISLTNLDITHFDTSSVNNMSSMFSGCNSLTNLDITHFDTQNVTNMQSMFRGCSNLTNLDLSNFDTQNVTSMGEMFSGCSGLTSVDASSFNTSIVTSMFNMFSYCNALTSLDLSSFDTSNVTNMSQMFNGCNSLTTAYGKTQADCDKFNGTTNKPDNVNFVVKS